MKRYYSILACLCCVAFICYWTTIFILAMPSSHARRIIEFNAPRFKNVFGNSWKLFTPPYTYDNRLYFIIRNVNRAGRPDTIEVLENISRQKQKKAPFNQRENVIDHLVNNSLIFLVKMVWYNKTKPTGTSTVASDSLYIAQAVSEMEKNKNYNVYLTTISNYGKSVLQNMKIDTAGKEIKIVIKEKPIRPFKDIAATDFLPKETLVFETPYGPIHQ